MATAFGDVDHEQLHSTEKTLATASSSAIAEPPRSNGNTEPDQTVAVDPLVSAKAAGLRYATDERPGITRRRSGKGWAYTFPDGKSADSDTRIRIKSLAIPPAWTDVWISPQANGHLQATGRDAKGRKQYRYHERWHEVRDEAKYGRLIAFAKALPRVREAVDADLALPGLPRRKLLAAIVSLLESTLIRVGNEEYARTNKSFGLSSMRNKHARVDGTTITFTFRGKSSKDHKISIADRRLAGIVKRSQDLPGQDLFQYSDEQGDPQTITSSDVNEYVKELSGDEFTAKDFRTWAGTVLATMALREVPTFETEAAAKRNIKQAIDAVAQSLGNTPAVCRKCYVHPAVIDAYMDGKLPRVRQSRSAGNVTKLAPEERAVLTLLERSESNAG